MQIGSKKRRLKSRKRCKLHGNQFTKDSAIIYSDEAINDPLGNSKHLEKTDDEHKVEGQLNGPRPRLDEKDPEIEVERQGPEQLDLDDGERSDFNVLIYFRNCSHCSINLESVITAVHLSSCM